MLADQPAEQSKADLWVRLGHILHYIGGLLSCLVQVSVLRREIIHPAAHKVGSEELRHDVGVDARERGDEDLEAPEALLGRGGVGE